MIEKVAMWVFRHPLESLAYEVLCCAVIVSVDNPWLELPFLTVQLSLVWLANKGERVVLEDLYARLLQVVEETQKEHELLYDGSTDSNYPGQSVPGQNDFDSDRVECPGDDCYDADYGAT